ncbi:MAG TPA: DUF1501 domain-containing protein [Planctomycetota bacterium]|nr:DUF1501 domain-containing protein [Planctomycetota bacterium]
MSTPDRGATRRSFLKSAAFGLAGAALAPRLFATPRAAATAAAIVAPRKLVLINLEGGYDALNLLPPLTGAVATSYKAQRPVLAVRSPVVGQPAPLVQPIPLPGSSAFGLHPSLGVISTEFAANKCAIVQKVGLPGVQLSHFKARDIMAAGRADVSVTDPRGWLGRLSDAHFADSSGVMGVGVGAHPVFNASTIKPAVITNLSNFSVQALIGSSETNARRAALLGMCDQSFAGEHRIPKTFREKTVSGSNLSAQLSTALASVSLPSLAGNPLAYGDPATENLASSLPDIAKLIAAPGLASRVFYTSTGDFDTHGYEEEQGPANKPTLTGRLSAVMTALGAFIGDLKSGAINQWSNTIIVLYTEFGRRNAENLTRGTDHGRGFHAFVLGGPVIGGLKGATVTANDLDASLGNENLPAQIDYRGLFKKLVQDGLQLDPTPVIDDYTPAPGEPSYTLF